MTYEQEIDTELAELYGKVQGIRGRLAMDRESLIRSAGGEKVYTNSRNRNQYVWRTRGENAGQIDIAAALELVREMIAAAETSEEKYPMNPLARGFEPVRETVEKVRRYEERLEELEAAVAEMRERELAYTGWSRFFLVTSSQGHIHSSMCCSTCRPTTTYGWLPKLSGQTEAEAVAECGPALCSVCFPSAPVEWTATKLTKAQAEKKAS